MDTPEMTRHLVKLFNSSYQRSILISNSEFTLSAVLACKEALSQKTVVLCEMDEIVSLLERDSSLKELLRAKISIALKEQKPLYKPLAS